jgi:hypothetical protein
MDDSAHVPIFSMSVEVEDKGLVAQCVSRVEVNVCSVRSVLVTATIPWSGLDSKSTDSDLEHIFESGAIEDMSRDAEKACIDWAKDVVALRHETASDSSTRIISKLYAYWDLDQRLGDGN